MATIVTYVPLKCKRCGSIEYKKIEGSYTFKNPVEIKELHVLTDRYNLIHPESPLEEPRSFTSELIDSCGCDKEEK